MTALRVPASLALLAALAAAQDAAPTGLLADFMRSPAVGVRLTPSFTWIVPPCASGAGDGTQTNFRIVVTTALGAPVWDSGKVAGNDSTYVAYAGPALAPTTRYAWTAATWTADCASPASAPASFVTAPWSGFAAGAQFLTVASATFGYFRKEVSVPAGVTSAVAFVAALVDEPLLSGYKLYVDDKLANIGPGRGEAPVYGGDGLFRSLPVTTIDLTAALGGAPAAATRALALQAMHQAPQVIMQLELTLADGSKSVVVTDGSWRAFNGDAHRVPGPAKNGGSAGTGFLEYIDARGEPVGWRLPGFVEGAGWAAAAGAAPTADQLANLHPRMQPAMAVDENVPAVAIRSIPSPPMPPSGPQWCGIAPENSNLELACWDGGVIQGVTFASFGTPSGSCPNALARNASCDAPTSLSVVSAACVGKKSCSVPATVTEFGGTDPCFDTLKSLAVQLQCAGTPPPPPPPSTPTSFLVDFGRELQGGIRLWVAEDGVAGSTVEIACGEHVTGDVVDYTWGWEFTWTLRDGMQILEQHKYMEFRFCRLTFSDAAPTFTLNAWRASYPWYETDSMFTSSNATLNAVYDLCRYTVFSAALDTYTDSNTRERTPYEADGMIAASGRILVQRDWLFPRHSHAYVLEHPTWPVEWLQITPFLAWQDHMATGQVDLALAFESRLHDNTKISFLENATGVLRTDKMGSHITDWMPDGDESDQTVARGENSASNHLAVCNGWAAAGLDRLAQMMALGGRAASAATYAAESAALAAAMDKLMWNASTGLWCDGICSEVGGNTRMMSSMFLTGTFGLTQALHGMEGVDAAWQLVEAWGLEQIGDYGAFFYQMLIGAGYYAPYYEGPDDGTAMMTALTKCDEYSWCSGLRDDNLTMTRESWHDGTYSHGWGSSAIVGVSWGIMGVHELSPGWATFLIKPKLGSLTNATIRVPTIRGYITVNAAPSFVSVDVPCNTAATLCTPRSAADGAAAPSAATHTLLVNGVEEPGAVFTRAGHACVPRALGCGAAGRAWELRLQPRAAAAPALRGAARGV